MEGEAVHMLQSGHHQWNKGQPTLQAFPATQRLNSRLHQISEETKKMAPKLVFVLPVVLLALALQAILRPPPPKLCGSPGGPPLTSPRIKLRDGRYLAYKEDGVQRDKARYKIITVHAFDSTKDFPSPVSKVKKKKIHNMATPTFMFCLTGFLELSQSGARGRTGNLPPCL